MKKSTKRFCLKIAAGFLSTTLVASVALPMQVLATNNANTNVDYIFANSSNNETPELRDEIISERTEYSKVFATSDGGFYKVVSTTPLHTLERNGTYSNIVEPNYELDSETAISDYIENVSQKSVAVARDVASYDLSSEDSTLGETSDLTIKCMNNKNVESDSLYVQGSSKGNRSIFIKPNSLESDGNKIITEAKLIAYSQGSGSSVNNFVVASRITSDWDEDSTEAPSSTTDYFDCNYVDTQATNYAWDITSLMNSWELGIHDNNGLALKTTSRKKNCNVSIQNITISYYYHVISEQDVTLASESIDMGRAGRLYINDFSSTPVLVRDEIGIAGEKNPVNIQRIYNSHSTNSNSPLGQQWRLNYRSTLTYSNYVYCWETFAGENIYFTLFESSSTKKTYRGYDYQGEQYLLTLVKSPTTGIFDYTYYPCVKIVGPDGSEYSFESHAMTGFVNSIVDGSYNTNTITIDYVTEDNMGNEYISDNIQEIVDGSGKQYVFHYDNSENTVLEKISVNNADGSEITTNCNGDDVAMEMCYTYEEDDNDQIYLSSVKYVDDTETDSVAYTYDDLGRLKTISVKDKVLTLNYTSGTTGNHISGYTITKGTEGDIRTIENVSIDSSDLYRRVFTNRDGETRVINFDKYFNIVYYKEYDGTILHGIVDNNELRYIEKIDNPNLVQNPDFSSIDDIEWPNGWISDVCELTIIHSVELNSDVLSIGGDTYYEGNAYQIVSPSGGFNAGDCYSFGAISQNSSALIPTSTRTYGVYVYTVAEDDDGIEIPGECLGHISFDETTDEWQSRVSSFTIPYDMDSVMICLRYDYNNESVYFDDVSIQKLDIGEGITNNYITTENGNGSILTKHIISSVEGNNSYIGFEYGYDGENGDNYLSSVTDENGIVTYYNYNPDNGILESIAVGNSSYVQNLTYNADKLLTEVSQTINTATGEPVTISNSYSYTDDGEIATITHNGYTYEYTYDDFGNLTSVGLSNKDYDFETYEYLGSYHDKIGSITYANGYVIEYSYNSSGNITEITRKTNIGETEDIISKYIYEYDNDGRIISVLDDKANIKMNYIDDNFTISTVNNGIVTEIYSREYSSNEITENYQLGEYYVESIKTNNESIVNEDYSTTQSYNQSLAYTEIATNSVVANIGINQTNIKDEFGRIKDTNIRKTYTGTDDATAFIFDKTDSYTYKSIDDVNSNKKETNLVSTYKIFAQSIIDENGTETASDLMDLTFHYSYDERGNITKIELTADDESDRVIYALYQYDELNQLVLEASEFYEFVATYSYDAHGNLLEKAYYDEYDIQTNTLPSEPIEVITYSYDTASSLGSPNLLTNYNGTNIYYDKMGNPLNYSSTNMLGDEINGTFEWNGNLLVAFENEDERYEYDYDETGLRTKKTLYSKTLVSDEEDEYTYTLTTEILYVWENNILQGVDVYDSEEGYGFYFNIIYDDNGIPQGYIGMTGAPFYFVRDGLGNIISVQSIDGELGYNVCYDAWGNPYYDFGSGINGVVSAIMAVYCPVSYNGYLYDFETNLYYCQNRYYSAAWGRFLSMDNLNLMKIDQLNLLSTNPYAYCCNDPVNRIDSNGCLSLRAAVNSTEEYLMNLNVYSFDFVANAFSTLIKVIGQEEMRSNKKMAIDLVEPLIVTMATIIMDRTYSTNNKINSYLIDIIYNYSVRYSVAPSIQHLLPAFRRAL